MAARVTSALSRRSTPESPRTRNIPRISPSPHRSTRSPGTCRISSTVAPVSPSIKSETNPRTVGASIGASAYSATRPAFELDEQIDRRLALLNAMRCVLVRDQPLGQGRQALGKVEQEVDPLLAVASLHVGNNRVECSRHGFAQDQALQRRAVSGGYAPLAIGARRGCPIPSTSRRSFSRSHSQAGRSTQTRSGSSARRCGNRRRRCHSVSGRIRPRRSP